MKGRHRDEHPVVRATRRYFDRPVTGIVDALVAYWQIAVVIALGVLAVIFAAAGAADAHPAPQPPQTGFITTGAEAGVTAGVSS